MSAGIQTASGADGVTFVEFPSECDFDADRVESVRAPLIGLIEDPASPKLVLDLGNVAFISSQALGFLVTLRLKAARAGKPIAIAGVRESLRDIVALTQIDKLYGVFHTRDDAAASLGG